MFVNVIVKNLGSGHALHNGLVKIQEICENIYPVFLLPIKNMHISDFDISCMWSFLIKMSFCYPILSGVCMFVLSNIFFYLSIYQGIYHQIFCTLSLPRLLMWEEYPIRSVTQISIAKFIFCIDINKKDIAFIEKGPQRRTNYVRSWWESFKIHYYVMESNNCLEKKCTL